MNTLLKWPGGKTREISQIENGIPSFDRYVEPFFGGGALYFHLKPKKALINDISSDLIDFYRLVQQQDPQLREYLLGYSNLLCSLIDLCGDHTEKLLAFYAAAKASPDAKEPLAEEIHAFLQQNAELFAEDSCRLILDRNAFENQLVKYSLDKLFRTVKNDAKKPFNDADLLENLITGFLSGFYMYFRDIHNDIALARRNDLSVAYRAANFYFIREYCYGSMFRYNRQGEFNIPYGGMSYNRKDLKSKINHIFSQEISELFSGTQLCCGDFEEFLRSANLTEHDFIFLDPPYDTEFSDYEGRAFGPDDQHRLAKFLQETPAQFILVIKNTEFIYSLYADHFNILTFDKTYTYNVRSRNDRKVEHLIITNLPAF